MGQYVIHILLLISLCGVSLSSHKKGKVQTKERELREILLDVIELELEDMEREIDDDKVKAVDAFLKKVNDEMRREQNKMSVADYNYKINITDYNSQKLTDVGTNYSMWYKPNLIEAREWIKKTKGLLDPDSDRQLSLFVKYSSPADENKVRQINDLESQMMKIYSTARVCWERENCLQMEPGLQEVMAKNRKPAELVWAWKNWRKETGPKIKPLYLQYIDLLNLGARENGYKDYGDFNRDKEFDNTPNLEALCDQLWTELKPLYLQLHAYVRRKLTEHYGKEIVGTSGAIPAHLLGNMWAQNWQNIADIVFPLINNNDDGIANTAEENLKKTYDVTTMFRLAEDFYKSIGLQPMTETFWKESMLVKPNDRNVTCHASAFDMYKQDDFRIKMCTEVSMEYLYTIHHEMGHVQYFMAYANQPTVYRTGANGAFHEAIGDTMTLSVLSRKHLSAIKLINEDSPEDPITDLLQMALSKIAFLPYGFLLDKWRWKMFSKEISAERLNKEYWNLRLEYQGVVSPVPRSEDDFDPAAKYHVPANSPYMIYFVSFITQFQFYKALCVESGHTGPLHTCDFYNSKEAGSKLRSMLELGASLPWPDALEKITGSRDISVEPIKEYFKPLTDWLTEQNKDEKLGWDDAKINWKD